MKVDWIAQIHVATRSLHSKISKHTLRANLHIFSKFNILGPMQDAAAYLTWGLMNDMYNFSRVLLEQYYSSSDS